MTRTATATRSTRRSNTVARLSDRGRGVVALTVAGLVILASLGHAGIALLAGAALYLLVSGRCTTVAKMMPSRVAMLRGLGWLVVAVATLTALNGSEAAGGPMLGLALAAALATYLRLSSQR